MTYGWFFGRILKIMTDERIAWQNPKLRIIDGGKSTKPLKNSNSAINMADRVMDEIGDSFPFRIIEGGKTEKTVNDTSGKPTE